VTVTTPVTGVTLNKATLALVPGGNDTLVATVQPATASNKTVTWASDAPGVATVSNGLVTAVGNGTVAITVTTVDGGFTASCTVTVTTPVTGVSLSPTTLALTVGDAAGSITAVVQPATASNKAVAWASSNSAVARVSGGGLNATVTPVSGGTATITVTTVDGGFAATCTVTVTSPVTGVSVSPTTLSLVVGGAAGSLTAALQPATASNKNVAWTSSRPGVATVSGGGLNATVAPVSAGTATITVTAVDGGFTATCAVTVATVPVTGVTLPGELGIPQGGYAELTAMVLPETASNKEVVWDITSGDGSATLGAAAGQTVTVIGAAMGSTTVRVTTVDGAKTAQCRVTVTKPLVGLGISTTWDHTLAVMSDGTLWAWGDNRYGKLGLGDTTNRNVPAKVGAATNWVFVAAGADHTLAIRKDGNLWAWGYNEEGQLGVGARDGNPHPNPARVGDATDWVSVSAGRRHNLALKSDGSLWAWGTNELGQLGIGANDYNAHPTPLRVGADADWVAVSAGGNFFKHSLALKSNGSLWAWGSGTNGLLGLGDADARHVPTKVGAATNWATIFAGASNSLAIQADGSLWAWGGNYNGQLGLGDTDAKDVPTQVGADTDWKTASAAFDEYYETHSLVVKTDGSLWACGSNNAGRLGAGDYAARTTLVRVGTATDWVAVSAGNMRSLGLKSDGTIWTWGYNEFGHLGLGDTANRDVPTLVEGLPYSH
jgi:uncharacterized protein YjdB